MKTFAQYFIKRSFWEMCTWMQIPPAFQSTSVAAHFGKAEPGSWGVVRPGALIVAWAVKK